MSDAPATEASVVDLNHPSLLDEDVSHHAEAMARFDEATAPVLARLQTGMISATHADLAAVLAAVRQGLANTLDFLINGPRPESDTPPGESLDVLAEQREAHRLASIGKEAPTFASPNSVVNAPTEGEATVSPEEPELPIAPV